MNPGRLLVLDDEPLVGQFISTVAVLAGFCSVATTTASQFFEELPCLDPTHIVLDVSMPDMDGVEVMRVLARQNCRAAIIIASGMESRILNAAERTGREYGLNMIGLLSKPFRPDQLRELLVNEQRSDQIAEPRIRTDPAEQAEEIATEAFKRALDDKELQLVYQPKVNCRTDHLAGFEALVRWNSPERGIVLPDLFLPIAESNGLMGKLTRQVIEQSVLWFSEFIEVMEASRPDDSHGLQTIRELTLSINLSARSLDDSSLFEFVMDKCQRGNIKPRQIIFELTESSALQDPVASLNLLTRLRVRGFRLSIDDFGSGFSSMIQLVRLPFSEVKLDRSFVMAALWSEEDRAVIRSIIDLGHSLGLVTTCEGVENLDTFEYLCQTDCDLAQGYFISRPISGSEAMDWGRHHLESWR